jgi:hypothetical protein
MKITFNINENLKEAVTSRCKELKIKSDEFWNIAGQNLVNMSKKGLPEANDIKNFELFIETFKE